MRGVEHFDLVILGAGIFGSYAALHFAACGQRVLLVDSERHPWKKASAVNQARVHGGYHYPRSVATAILANDHRERFTREHRDFIGADFTALYGIDAYGSLTNAQQFQRFCDFIGIPCREVSRPDIIAGDRLEALFETREQTFDPLLIRGHYTALLAESSVTTRFGARPTGTRSDGSLWVLTLSESDDASETVTASGVLSATYSNINSVNRLFGFDELDASHEISEIAFVHSAALAGVGLTVMDGPYFSVMPFGKSVLHSLSSVTYTHHIRSMESDPEFFCQASRRDCHPQALRVCTNCIERPRSNMHKMISQARQYLKDAVDLAYHGSLFTVKTTMKSSYVDDARPTEIRVIQERPMFASVFSGKINSIYEIESFSYAP